MQFFFTNILLPLVIGAIGGIAATWFGLPLQEFRRAKNDAFKLFSSIFFYFEKLNENPIDTGIKHNYSMDDIIAIRDRFNALIWDMPAWMLFAVNKFSIDRKYTLQTVVDQLDLATKQELDSPEFIENVDQAGQILGFIKV